MSIKNVNKKIIHTCFLIIVLFVMGTNILSSKKTIEKETIKKSEINNLKTLDQEGQNYRLVTSADNVQVPVPKGYVASNVTGENYVTPEYSHTTITHKVSSTATELTWSSPVGEEYPWTQDENGIWISGNQGISWSTSILESEEFVYIKGTTLTVNYTYSCASGDYITIYLIDITNNMIHEIVRSIYGNTESSFDYTTSNYTYTMNNWETGRYKIRAKYQKDYSGNGGQDSGYIKTSTYFKEDENGENIVEDIKTKIRDGGFVIYQLTDAELETDPNGTNVIINDTNKDEEQSTRNQYVWVPVPNIEDIVRIKNSNNSKLQFGQNYIFTNTSITKQTNTNSNHYSEPRLIVNYDKTKYYLQKYSKINRRENHLNTMQEDLAKMIKSINKYKGFYIGRYETGDDVSHDNKNRFIDPKIVRYNSNINLVTWYDSYNKLERLAKKTGEYVETGMIFNSLYDYTIKWLNETDTINYEDISEDSGSWGNYENNRLKYKESVLESIKTKNEEISNIIPTGGITEITYKGETYSDSPAKSNNIFDIAGNVSERTRSYERGGQYSYNGYDRPVGAALMLRPYEISYYMGTRAQLLIK